MGRDRSRSRGDDRGRGRDDDRGRGRDDRDRGRDEDRGRDRRDERPKSRERESRRGDDVDRDRKKEKEPEPDDDTFKPGRQVMVKGLQKNPEKNGSVGNLVEFNAEKGRWVVAISGGNNNFKEENLELMADNSDVVDDKEEPPTAKIYITKLSADVTDKDLLTLFGGCGLVEREPPKSGPKGFRDTWPMAVKLYKPGKADGDACLTYMDPQSAKAAIKTFHRYKFKGSKIGVAYAGQGVKYEKVELSKPWYLREENQGKLDREGGGGGSGKDGGKGPKPGDWKCEGCGADVFASKDTCFKCGESKPSGGGGGGKGSKDDDRDGGKGGGKDKGGKGGDKGGKSGDWTCPGCSANVFASKDSCFKCGESKPGGGGGGSRGGGGKGNW